MGNELDGGGGGGVGDFCVSIKSGVRCDQMGKGNQNSRLHCISTESAKGEGKALSWEYGKRESSQSRECVTARARAADATTQGDHGD